jgi:hypothetical protein
MILLVTKLRCRLHGSCQLLLVAFELFLAPLFLDFIRLERTVQGFVAKMTVPSPTWP